MPQNIFYQALCPDIYFFNTKTHVVSIFIANKSNKKKNFTALVSCGTFNE